LISNICDSNIEYDLNYDHHNTLKEKTLEENSLARESAVNLRIQGNTETEKNQHPHKMIAPIA